MSQILKILSGILTFLNFLFSRMERKDAEKAGANELELEYQRDATDAERKIAEAGTDHPSQPELAKRLRDGQF